MLELNKEPRTANLVATEIGMNASNLWQVKVGKTARFDEQLGTSEGSLAKPPKERKRNKPSVWISRCPVTYEADQSLKLYLAV